MLPKTLEIMSFSTFLHWNLLAPRPHRLRNTGGPGTQIKFALEIIFRSHDLLHEYACIFNSASSFKLLPNAVSVQEMSPNVSQSETFAGGNTAGNFPNLFKSHGNSKLPQDVKCLWPFSAGTYGLLTKCEVNMAEYWPSSFFACL